MRAIAHAYWRQIKRGVKTYEAIPDIVKDDVKTLAKTDVENGIITAEDYADYIGEKYVK
ncbi:MAG: hypothetical protein ACOYBH_07805 [Candidatus Alectryocaccobium sp.]|jgi:hypothetical protein